MDIEKLVKIRSSKKAVHGGDVWSHDVKFDFSSNVNPIGPSEKVIRAISERIAKIQHYPDIDATELRTAISEYVGVKPEHVVLGNGSMELIKNFCEMFVRDKNVVIPVPTFSEYEVYSRLYGANLRYVPLKPEKIIEVIDSNTGAVFLCNPNNPTGGLLDKNEILMVTEAALDVSAPVLLDEAYIEFSDCRSLCVPALEFENLFVLRSLTKFFSLSGLRVGYGVANKILIECMERLRVPWNVNTLAQVGGVESLKDKKFIRKSRDFIKTERNFLYDELSKFLKVKRTHANFFLIDLDGKIKARKLKEMLLERGILIRDCSTFTGLDNNFIRVCVRKHAENVILVEELRFAMGFIMKSTSDCKYYPCHIQGHDCTFCFCPFYPCLDDLTGGRYVISKKTKKEVWSCKKCDWIHKKDIARAILNELDNIQDDDRKSLLEFRLSLFKHR